jgi:protoporphyrinogen oxidase
MTPQRVVIIGAGPAGLTAGYCLAKAGIHVTIYEASEQVGGMCRTIDLWDQKVDIGPHRFFSTDLRVNELWLEVVGKDYHMVNRLTRIYYKGRFFYYPVQLFNVLKNLGVSEAITAVFSYLRQRLFPEKFATQSFESWMVPRFGRKLYALFFSSYTEKLWGISCTELDADFAAQRIKKLSLAEAIKNMLFGDPAKKHKTLVDRFAYPFEGTGMVYSRMAKAIEEMGGVVHVKSPVQKVLVDNNIATGVQLFDGSEHLFDHVISTMPLTRMVSQLPNLPQTVVDSIQKLRFRHTMIVYLYVEKTDLFPDNWIYINDPGLKTGRITNFRNWVPELYGADQGTILAMEFWCYEEDAAWHAPEQEWVALATREILETKLLTNASWITKATTQKVPNCYPVYQIGYKDSLAQLEVHLKNISQLQAIGRYGLFKYNNQDHSILMGILAAQKITGTADDDLWRLNTDYETYQEASLISETGLEKVSAL